MAETTTPYNADSYEAGEASAGTAHRVDSHAVRARSEAPALLPQQDLDARQAALGERRRRGGPSLDEEPEEGARTPGPTGIPAREASTGGARRVDATGVRLRTEAPALLPQQDLDARQAALGERRRRGGPSLDEEPEEGARTPSSMDVPATQCEEPRV